MTHSVDWIRLLEQRRLLADEADEATIQAHLAHWREALSGEGTLTDEALDEQMVKLLELIHHAR